MDAPANEREQKNLRIESFRDECLLFLDFNRPVFLEEIERFVNSSDKVELAKLRRWIASHERALKARRRERGRPRDDSDPQLLTKAKVTAWRRHVHGFTWRQAAEAEGLKATKENIRTLVRRRDRFAAVVWDALTEVLGDRYPTPERIARALDHIKVRQWLWMKAGLPFQWSPEDCKRLVMALAPLARIALGPEWNTPTPAKPRRSSEMTVK